MSASASSGSESSAELSARDIVAVAERLGLTVAVAESLTAGLVCARIADVPGASAVLRGGVVAYSTDLKASLLGVDPELLARHGPVHPDVALAMATGARDRLSADVGLATTGVAGPSRQGGRAPGIVFVAVVRAGPGLVRELALPGDRAAVRLGAVDAVLALLAVELDCPEHVADSRS